ncbi:MAG: hypothetical protein WC977_07300 [Anaerovoracaceae bacterium]|jgi:hypothetical protein
MMIERARQRFESIERHVRGLEQMVAAVETMLEETVEQVARLKDELGLTGQPELPLPGAGGGAAGSVES